MQDEGRWKRYKGIIKRLRYHLKLIGAGFSPLLMYKKSKALAKGRKTIKR